MRNLLIVIFVCASFAGYSQFTAIPRTAHDTCFVGNHSTSYTIASFADTTNFGVTVFQDGFNLQCQRGEFWAYDATVGLFIFASPIEADEKVCITIK